MPYSEGFNHPMYKVTEIANGAFMGNGADGLEDRTDIPYTPTADIYGYLTIPDTVEKIGEFAFFGQNFLGMIRIGKNVSDIHQSTFGKTPSLESIIVSEENKTFQAVG